MTFSIHQSISLLFVFLIRSSTCCHFDSAVVFASAFFVVWQFPLHNFGLKPARHCEPNASVLLRVSYFDFVRGEPSSRPHDACDMGQELQLKISYLSRPTPKQQHCLFRTQHHICHTRAAFVYCLHNDHSSKLLHEAPFACFSLLTPKDVLSSFWLTILLRIASSTHDCSTHDYPTHDCSTYDCSTYDYRCQNSTELIDFARTSPSVHSCTKGQEVNITHGRIPAWKSVTNTVIQSSIYRVDTPVIDPSVPSMT